MERRILIGTYSDDNHENRIEDFECDYQKDALKAYKEVIERFNNTLRPGESARKAISAKWKEKEVNFYCDFEKTNMFTLKDSKGYYDRMKCRNCGKVRKRYSLDGSELKGIKCKVLETKQREIKHEVRK